MFEIIDQKPLEIKIEVIVDNYEKGFDILSKIEQTEEDPTQQNL